MAATAIFVSTSSSHGSTLLNGGFEAPDLGGGAVFEQLAPANVPGWDATENLIEIWANGFNGVTSFEGTQHAEINAEAGESVFQELSGLLAGESITLKFAHRARVGTDVMRAELADLGGDGSYGTADDTVLFDREFSATTEAWVFSSTDDFGGVTGLGGDVRLSFFSISTGSGNPSIGNFLDAVSLHRNAPPPTVMPLPMGAPLLASGLLALAVLRQRRKRRLSA